MGRAPHAVREPGAAGSGGDRVIAPGPFPLPLVGLGGLLNSPAQFDWWLNHLRPKYGDMDGQVERWAARAYPDLTPPPPSSTPHPSANRDSPQARDRAGVESAPMEIANP